MTIGVLRVENARDRVVFIGGGGYEQNVP